MNCNTIPMFALMRSYIRWSLLPLNEARCVLPTPSVVPLPNALRITNTSAGAYCFNNVRSYLSGLGRKEKYPRSSDNRCSADDHPSRYFGPSIYLGTENLE